MLGALQRDLSADNLAIQLAKRFRPDGVLLLAALQLLFQNYWRREEVRHPLYLRRQPVLVRAAESRLQLRQLGDASATNLDLRLSAARVQSHFHHSS